MDDLREERDELERLHRDLWEPDRDDYERELILDAFMADCRLYEQTGA